jgi:hypothetical protein
MGTLSYHVAFGGEGDEVKVEERELKKRDNASWTSVTEKRQWVKMSSDK